MKGDEEARRGEVGGLTWSWVWGSVSDFFERIRLINWIRATVSRASMGNNAAFRLDD